MIWIYTAAFAMAVFIVVSVFIAVGNMLSPKNRQTIGGSLIVLFIIYIIGGFVYAIATAEQRSMPDDEPYCPGPPYSVC